MKFALLSFASALGSVAANCAPEHCGDWACTAPAGQDSWCECFDQADETAGLYNPFCPASGDDECVCPNVASAGSAQGSGSCLDEAARLSAGYTCGQQIGAVLCPGGTAENKALAAAPWMTTGVTAGPWCDIIHCASGASWCMNPAHHLFAYVGLPKRDQPSNEFCNHDFCEQCSSANGMCVPSYFFFDTTSSCVLTMNVSFFSLSRALSLFSLLSCQGPQLQRLPQRRRERDGQRQPPGYAVGLPCVRHQDGRTVPQQLPCE